MKKIDFTKASRLMHKTGFAVRKHSPAILITAGVVGVVTSTVMACKATTKINDIMDKAKEDLDTIHSASSMPETLPEGSSYTERIRNRIYESSICRRESNLLNCMVLLLYWVRYH